jgi:hypothetical protein
MRKSVLIALSCLGLAIAQNAFASGVTSAKVTSFFTTQDDVFFIYFDQNIANGASCGSGTPNRLAIKISSPGGKTMIAAVLAAATTGKSVSASGTGNCNDWGDTESVQYLWFTP